MSRRDWLIIAPAIVLSFGGVYLSGQLLAKHLHAPGVPEWIQSICGSGDGGGGCDAVLSSRWGVFPPASESGGARHRIPVAMLGQAYFSVLLVWFVAVGRPGGRGRHWQLVPLLLSGIGVIGSLGFVWVMWRELKAWCPLCTTTHVINGLLFVTVAAGYPRRPKSADSEPKTAGTGDRLIASRAAGGYPSLRLVLVTGCLAVILIWLQSSKVAITGLARQRDVYLDVAREVEEMAGALASRHLQSPQHEIEITDHDPIRYPNGTETLVVWSDFECPHCKAFADKLEQVYLKDFEGKLRVVFKHYPLNQTCNEYMTSTPHPQACFAARIAEAAHMQGGDAAFWNAHDGLFQSQTVLGKLEPAKVAVQLGLDSERLVKDMNSEEVTRRIQADVAEAHRLGVRGTPAVFLEGREVDRIARNVPGFWRLMALQLKRQNTPGQPHEPATNGGEATTPDSPDPPDAR